MSGQKGTGSSAPVLDRHEEREAGVPISPQQISQYLESLRRKGCTAASIQKYRRDLTSLYLFLPGEKRIGVNTLEEWRTALLGQGYAVRTINTCVIEANGFLRWLGAWEYRLDRQITLENDVQPELTRNEYIRLLSAAKALGRERAYLLVKVFACMGLTLRELPQLTKEALDRNRLAVSVQGVREIVSIPDCLRRELLVYARRGSIAKGPLFVTRTGKPLNRTSVAAAIQALSNDAQVQPEKCNVRCLRKLYWAARKDLRENMALLMEQTYNRMLETEQLLVGWEEADGHEP